MGRDVIVYWPGLEEDLDPMDDFNYPGSHWHY